MPELRDLFQNLNKSENALPFIKFTQITTESHSIHIVSFSITS